MKPKNDDGVVLQPIESTSLYKPVQPGPGENLLFLLRAAGTHDKTIPLEDTWDSAGTPSLPGYFLFLNVLPASGTFAAFEQEIRKALAGIAAPAFAWVVYDRKTQSVKIQTLLKTKVDKSQRCVDGNTELVLLPGQKRVGFSDGTPILTATRNRFITDFIITYPTVAGAMAPEHAGVVLPMTGPLVGCVRFAGLVNPPSARQTSSSARKTLVDVAIDPLRPLDAKRNFQRFSGENFILTQDGDSYSISRAS